MGKPADKNRGISRIPLSPYNLKYSSLLNSILYPAKIVSFDKDAIMKKIL